MVLWWTSRSEFETSISWVNHAVYSDHDCLLAKEVPTREICRLDPLPCMWQSRFATRYRWCFICKGNSTALWAADEEVNSFSRQGPNVFGLCYEPVFSFGLGIRAPWIPLIPVASRRNMCMTIMTGLVGTRDQVSMYTEERCSPELEVTNASLTVRSLYMIFSQHRFWAHLLDLILRRKSPHQIRKFIKWRR